MGEEKDPIQEINEFVETLMALAPTNSRISQFVLMANNRKDFNSLKEMYFELLGDRRTKDRVLKALDMSIGSDGKITIGRTFSHYLDIIEHIFELFEKPDVRDKMAAALLNEKISNLREDWIWARLKTIEDMSKEEGSPAAVSILILKILKKLPSYSYVELDSISENIGETVDKSVLAEAIDILEKFGLLYKSGEKYGLSHELERYKSLIDDIGGE